MKNKLSLTFIVFLFWGVYSLSAQNYYINNQTSGTRTYTVPASAEVNYYINAGVSKYIQVSFSVQDMGSTDQLFIKTMNGGIIYEGDGYDFQGYNFSHTIITPDKLGTVVIGYRNSNSGPLPTLHFDFKTEDDIKFDLVGIGMQPAAGKRLSVFGDSYFNGKVGIGTIMPSATLDVNGSVRGTSVYARNSSGDYMYMSPYSSYALISTNRAYFYIAKPLRVYQGQIGSYSSQNLQLQTNGTTKMTILNSNGHVGIGVANPQNKLEVNGAIRAKEVIVETGWADFVFTDTYQLPPLDEVKKHITEKGHLPGIPTEAEVLGNGVNLGDMQVKLLQKIEELTLYMIKQEEKSEEYQLEIRRLNEDYQLEIKRLCKRIEELENFMK